MKHLRVGLFALAWLFVESSVRPAAATNPACITDSTAVTDAGTGYIVDADLIDSAPCGVYGTANSRFQPVNGVETQVTVPYMKHEPPSGVGVKAIAVLFTGSDGDAFIEPDPCINNNPPCDPVPVTHSGGNFLVRSAQLFAERGFRTLTIDQPSPLPSGDTCGGTGECYDVYRQGQRQALDIAAVVRQENPGRKPVFLVGTSRGAESAVSQNLLGIGAMLSSPVTSTTTGIPNPCDANHKPYVGDCFYGALQAPFVTIPVQILVHDEDPNTVPCSAARVANAQNLQSDLSTNGNGGAGVQTFFRSLSGGFEVVDPNTGVVVDACGPESFHGFLGIETDTVRRIARRVTRILKDIQNTFGPDHPPISGNATRTLDTSVSTSRTINLANLASDPDGDPLTFTLVHPKSARSATLTLSGSVVTYDASSAPYLSTSGTHNDGFVYVTSDGNGRKSFGIIKITATVP